MKRLAVPAALLLLGAACGGDDAAPTATSTTTVAVTTTSVTEPVATTAEPVATTAEPVTTTPPPPEPDNPFEVVVAFYDSLNTEDVEGMAALWPTGERERFRMRTEGLHQKVSTTCFPGDAGEGWVQCDDSVGNDDFYAPAGVGVVATVAYRVAHGVIVDSEVVAWPEEWDRYVDAFGAWLETAHPDLYTDAYRIDGGYPFATAEDALAVVAVLDEFLEQSDEYPIAE